MLAPSLLFPKILPPWPSDSESAEKATGLGRREPCVPLHSNLTLWPDGHFLLRQRLGELERGTWAAAAWAQPCRVLRPPLAELFSLPDFPKWRGQDTWVPKREMILAEVRKLWGVAGQE